MDLSVRVKLREGEHVAWLRCTRRIVFLQMPTSSQALILIRTDSGKLSALYKSCITPDMPFYPLSKVNLTGKATTARRGRTMPVGPDTMVDSHPEAFKASKPLKGLTVNGYRGVLSFDPMLKSFRWQLLPDPTDSQSHRLINASHKSSSAPDMEEHHHVQEEVVLTNIDDLPDRTSIAENTYRRLLDLGFRTTSFPGIDSSPILESWDSRTPESEFRRQHPARPTTARTRSPQHGLTTEKNMSAPVIGPVMPHPPPLRNVVGIKKDGISENQLSGNTSSEENVLPDEVKKTSRRKKHKLPSIRMRRHLPPPSPNALCFCLRDKRPYSHKEIKVLLEDQINTRIGALLYDPVYMHLGPDNADGACLWAFTIENEALRMLLLYKGITFEGERVRVRKYDDVMHDEHQAFKMYNAVDEEQRRRKLNTTLRRESLKPISGGVRLGLTTQQAAESCIFERKTS